MSIVNSFDEENEEIKKFKFWIWMVLNLIIVIYAVILVLCGRKFQKSEFISDVFLINFNFRKTLSKIENLILKNLGSLHQK